MKKRHWLNVIVLISLVVYVSAEVNNTKKSSIKKKSGKSTKRSRVKGSSNKPQADPPASNGDELDDDYSYDYDDFGRNFRKKERLKVVFA